MEKSKVTYLAKKTNDGKMITVDQALDLTLEERKQGTGMLGSGMLLVTVNEETDGTWTYDWKLVNLRLSEAMCTMKIVEQDLLGMLLGVEDEDYY